MHVALGLLRCPVPCNPHSNPRWRKWRDPWADPRHPDAPPFDQLIEARCCGETFWMTVHDDHTVDVVLPGAVPEQTGQTQFMLASTTLSIEQLDHPPEQWRRAFNARKIRRGPPVLIEAGGGTRH